MVPDTKKCDRCGATVNDTLKFCPKCGRSLRIPRGITGGRLLGGLKSSVKVIGDKTISAGERAKGMLSQEKATEATRNLLNLVTTVAREVRKDLPPDMVKAVDLRANVSFIAFSIGVSVDLEKLQTTKVKIQEHSQE
jgi:hypothetical protein